MSKPLPGQRCIACGQVLPTDGRICGNYHKPIGRHDKWRFGPEGKAVHRDCENPTLKGTAE